MGRKDKRSIPKPPTCARCDSTLALGLAIMSVYTIANGEERVIVCSACYEDLKNWLAEYAYRKAVRDSK